jgi:hypothetical protein
MTTAGTDKADGELGHHDLGHRSSWIEHAGAGALGAIRSETAVAGAARRQRLRVGEFDEAIVCRATHESRDGRERREADEARDGHSSTPSTAYYTMNHRRYHPARISPSAVGVCPGSSRASSTTAKLEVTTCNGAFESWTRGESIASVSPRSASFANKHR